MGKGKPQIALFAAGQSPLYRFLLGESSTKESSRLFWGVKCYQGDYRIKEEAGATMGMGEQEIVHNGTNDSYLGSLA